ncbi:PTS sugar transporter subunit IIB [Facklamia miroungae]|uniref:PTS system, cellobiose-specific IIB component n=1 Tax=Facklamia miroungae TaxID=120956 RepID=A0A1G7RUF4_9LACT|nr:PTS sugar transporter subunit IIB [Facklamia miroungae]NKZ29289.1 PTS sugar transporter subunit IIB [Facklamia miroungae]SDG13809.1 PTS system, cellobiose-specific IIB component [Facklamia miroungae]
MSKKTIMLVCGTGMSTTMLVNKMNNIVKSEGLDYDIISSSIQEMEDYVNKQNIDVLLLGPQVSYLSEGLSKQYAPKKIVVDSIDKNDYGLANGKKVLAHAESLLD